MNCITFLYKRLEETALNGSVLSTPEYIKMMMNNEEKEHQNGWVERIESLKELMELAKLAKDIVNNREDFTRKLNLFD